jgi:AcrR family transcriptional regulator
MRKNARELSYQHIVEAGWRLALEKGVSAITISNVAQAAGLTRQAVYWHMATRAQLLLEIARFNDTRLPEADLVRHGLPDSNAVTSFLAAGNAWCDALPKVTPFWLALEAASARDDDAREAFQNRIRGMRSLVLRHVQRLASEGALRSDLSTEDAADIVQVQTLPSNWHVFHEVHRWPLEKYRAYLLAFARQFILAQSAE